MQPLSFRSTLSIVGFAAFQSGVVGEDLPQYPGGRHRRRELRPRVVARLTGRQAAGDGTVSNYAYDVVPVRSFTVFGLNLYGGIQAAAFSDVGLA